MVREASKKTNKHVALLLDTKGPEMRLGLFKEGKVLLEAGQKFVLTARDVEGTNEIASVNHKRLPQEVTPGQPLLLNDGMIALYIESVEGDNIITTVKNTGQISDRKRVAAPGASISLPPLSEQDIADLKFGIEADMDFIAASFIQRPADVLAIRKVLEESGTNMEIIAKIENAEGVKNIDEILKVADGVMVARGDLGVEIPTEEVPMVQKMIIKKCNRAGKPVITATQMLESMMGNPRPTRAEASDIANAILDGSDAIMLSGETASGQYPLEAVKTMVSIAVRTESSIHYSEILAANALSPQKTTTDAISHASVQVAYDLSAAVIMTSTYAGYTARMISKYRPRAVIVATTPSEKSLRRMLLLWGVLPILGPSSTNTDELVQNAINTSLNAGFIKNGDLLVFTAGVPLGMSGTTNMIRVYVVGDALLKGSGIGNTSATGKVCIVKSLRDIETKFKTGDVLVISGVDEETAVYAANASAIIAEEGGFTSHAAVVGISYGIPVLIGVDGATDRLTDGTLVTVDPARGTVYQGEINAR
jgi:pyruvate kinase